MAVLDDANPRGKGLTYKAAVERCPVDFGAVAEAWHDVCELGLLRV
ncbi:MAG: hypothetical protein ACJAZO_004027 [Myxococcota bacterium]|jgi:hypothetical protein